MPRVLAPTGVPQPDLQRHVHGLHHEEPTSFAFALLATSGRVRCHQVRDLRLEKRIRMPATEIARNPGAAMEL
jgi:hypothetical protein